MGAVSAWLQKKFASSKKELEKKEPEPREEEITGSEMGSIDQLADGLDLNESGKSGSDEEELEGLEGLFNN